MFFSKKRGKNQIQIGNYYNETRFESENIIIKIELLHVFRSFLEKNLFYYTK